MCNPITRSDDDRARQSGGSERTDTADADVDVADAPPPPDPGGLPVLGNVHELASDALGFYERRSAEYGGIVRYDVFGTESYLVTDPGAIGRILVEDHDRFVKGEMPREQLGGLLGDGLFLAEGEAWREQRTAIRSAFFRERVAAYGDSMVEHAREAVDSWGDGAVVDVHAASTEYAFAVLAESLLGSDIEGERETVRAAAEAITDRFDMSRPTSFLPEWLPTPANRRYRRRLGALRATIRDLVTERRAAGPPADPSAADDLLGTLVAAAKLGALDDEELVDNAVTFLFAGHETSALRTDVRAVLSRAPPRVSGPHSLRNRTTPRRSDARGPPRVPRADRGGRRGASPVSPGPLLFQGADRADRARRVPHPVRGRAHACTVVGPPRRALVERSRDVPPRTLAP
jgi:Cytochrome P450